MPIYSGSTELTDIKIGGTDVQSVYVGSTQVWSRFVPPTGTAFDVVSVVATSGTQNVALDLGGATPAVAEIIAVAAGVENDRVSGFTMSTGYWHSGSGQGCVTGGHIDGALGGRQRQSTTQAVYVIAGNGTIQGIARVTGAASNQLTLTWDTAPATALRLQVSVLEVTDAYVEFPAFQSGNYSFAHNKGSIPTLGFGLGSGGLDNENTVNSTATTGVSHGKSFLEPGGENYSVSFGASSSSNARNTVASVHGAMMATCRRFNNSSGAPLRRELVAWNANAFETAAGNFNCGSIGTCLLWASNGAIGNFQNSGLNNTQSVTLGFRSSTLQLGWHSARITDGVSAVNVQDSVVGYATIVDDSDKQFGVVGGVQRGTNTPTVWTRVITDGSCIELYDADETLLAKGQVAITATGFDITWSSSTGAQVHIRYAALA